jgi:hypothetical protein
MNSGDDDHRINDRVAHAGFADIRPSRSIKAALPSRLSA